MKVLLSIFAIGFGALASFYGVILNQRGAEWVKNSPWDKLIIDPPFGYCLFGSFLIIAAINTILLYNYPTPSIDTTTHYSVQPAMSSQLGTTDNLRKELEGEAIDKVNKAEAYFKAAFHDYEAKRLNDAIKNCQKSIDILPSVAAYVNLSAYLTYASDHRRTEDAYNKGIQLAQEKNNRKDESTLLSNRAGFYDDRGQREKAILDLNKAIDLDPNNSAAHFNLAVIYYKTFLYENALKEIDKGIALEGDTRDFEGKGTRAYELRGAIKSDQGLYDEALINFNKSIQANSKFYPAYNNRGIAYLKLGQIDLSISDFNKAIELAPSIAEFYTNRAQAYAMKGLSDKGILDCNTAIKLNSGYWKPYHVRGRIYADKKHYDRAILDFNRAIEINPKDEKTFLYRGMVYEIKGIYDKALSDFESAININPKYAEAYFHQAKAFAQRGLLDDAFVNYGKAININPQYVDALINRSGLYIRKEELDKALNDLNQAIKINAKSPEAYNNRGCVYMFKKLFDKSMADFNKAIELKPDHPDALINRGRLFKLTGHKESAEKDFKRACSLGIVDGCIELDSIHK